MASYSSQEQKALDAFGSKLRSLRKKRGLSQEKFAECAGLHRTYIGSAERGERNVALLNILRFSEALGVEPKELLEP